MAQTTYSTHSLPIVAGARVAIIQSKWYREYTDLCVRRCREVLGVAQAEVTETSVLPGSLELPLAARQLARRDPSLEAIIAFGIILKGETDHYEAVRDTCMEGLARVMFEENIPVIIEVLPVYKIEHAAARCADNDHNKGIEAAIAAAETIAWRRAHPVLPK